MAQIAGLPHYVAQGVGVSLLHRKVARRKWGAVSCKLSSGGHLGTWCLPV